MNLVEEGSIFVGQERERVCGCGRGRISGRIGKNRESRQQLI